MYDKTVRDLIFDLDGATRRVLNTIKYYEQSGTPWPFPTPCDYDFIHGFLIAKVKDVCESTLKHCIRDKNLVDYTHLYIMEIVGNDDNDLLVSIEEAILNMSAAEWIDEILSYLRPDSYDVWRVEPRDNYICLHHVGDFRIYQWEQEHMLKGKYHADPIPVGRQSSF